MPRTFAAALLSGALLLMTTATSAAEFHLSLREQKQTAPESRVFVRRVTDAAWRAEHTAVIVCDVWDKHHCLNAVRRLEEFAPRMNQVLKAARNQGATIIHAPSDCMPAYVDHPARRRAMAAPVAARKPADIEFWCSKIPSEEQAVYPLDQSDGGVDDDPVEQERWAAELKALGRDPGLPWKSQSALIDIDAERDFISDRGDEVWNILDARGIENVILVGVHTNMCVLGRPFGLRQMVRSGKNVVLMRDMTDSMYNPQRWPYVDHFTGHDLIISHVERYVCPTITSDQILGGEPFVSKYDTRSARDIASLESPAPTLQSFSQHWTTAKAGDSWSEATGGVISAHQGPAWYRCTLRLPSGWVDRESLELRIPNGGLAAAAWLNGVRLEPSANPRRLLVPADAVSVDDINLLVVRSESPTAPAKLPSGFALISGARTLQLDGRWQFRLGDDPTWSSVPLPAKFALGSDVLFEAR